MEQPEISREQTEQVLAALARIRGRRGGGRRPGPQSTDDPRNRAGDDGHATAHGLHPADPRNGGVHRGGHHDGPHHDGDHAASSSPFSADHPRHRRPRSGDWFGGPGARFGGPARLRVLEALAAASGPLSVSEVADAVGVDQPRASRLIQQAADSGLVVREPDPDDARRTRVRLTPEGASFATGARGHRHELIGTALASLSDDDRAEFVRLLTAFAAAWPEDG